METFKEIFMDNLSAEELLEKMKAKGIQFNKYAEMLFEHSSFLTSGKARKVKLVKVNLTDLKLAKPTRFQDIVSAAAEKGLKLCPLNLAPFLRLEYLDQPEGPYLTIASLKIEDDEKFPRGFYLRKLEGVLWLRGFCASDDWEYPLDMEFVFQQ